MVRKFYLDNRHYHINSSDIFKVTTMGTNHMRHLIERVLELQSDEKVEPVIEATPIPNNDQALENLLRTLTPRIRVYGCGGCGCNTVNRLAQENLLDNNYVIGYAINTDAQHLLRMEVPNKLLIGRTARGHGAGGNPEKGEAAAYESERPLKKIVEDTDLAFITCGLGGGTGTGSAHVLAKLAKQEGALTIAVVTYPFNSEGTMRRQHAEWGLERLRDICDTVVVMPNERLLHVNGVKDLPISAAFRVADELLMRSIAGISELITKDGLVNSDFMDLKSVMENGGGVAMIGLGESTGVNRATEATMQALESPLLDIDVSDARGALINVVCGPSLTLGEAEEAASLIRNQINPNAKIIWGATVDENMKEELRVMVVLTGVRSQHIFGAAATNQLKALKHRSIEFVN